MTCMCTAFANGRKENAVTKKNTVLHDGMRACSVHVKLRGCTLSRRLSFLLSLSLSFSFSLSHSLWLDVCWNHCGASGNHTLVVEMCCKQYEKYIL